MRHDVGVNIFDRIEAGWDSSIAWARRHSRAFDHAWRARERYNEVLGGRLAAAMAYYSFFAAFALALVAYAVVGYVLANSASAVAAVDKFLHQNVPFLNAGQIAESRTTVAVVGLIGLVFTGVGWIESVRSSQRAIWRLDQQPGNFFIRRLVDLGIMVAIGLLLALSLWVQNGINNAVAPVLLRVTPETVGVGLQQAISTTVTVVGVGLSLTVNVLLAACLLSGVSRLRMPLRRLMPASLLVAVGLSVLSSFGRLYVNYSSHRPAYQVVGGTVALLLFLYLFHQLLLFGAALAATATSGQVVDLAAGPAPVAYKSAPAPPRKRMMGRVGALVTLRLPEDSPVRAMPWIITIGPLDDEAEWEPVVCGPYEYPHALALAEEVVADEELMAVMEPLLGLASPDEIRREIDLARATAEQEVELDEDFDEFDAEAAFEAGAGFDHGAGFDADHGGGNSHPSPPLPPADEVRAGMARIARRLAQPG